MCIVTKTLCRGGARESNQNCDYNIVVTCARLVTARVSTDFRKSKQNADGEDIKLMILGKLFQRPMTHL